MQIRISSADDVVHDPEITAPRDAFSSEAVSL
jgi:hypothetical protein